ncbi:MFS general substrate transporter [Mycena latifolia]|nr:MFS general substrate transporter [Mycena latifolia]
MYSRLKLPDFLSESMAWNPPALDGGPTWDPHGNLEYHSPSPSTNLMDDMDTAQRDKETQPVPSAPHNLESNSRADGIDSAVADVIDVPDGGALAWRTVLGAWLVFIPLGSTFTFGVFEDFYTRDYLINHSPSSISWIGSFQLMLRFLLSPIAGKLFDDGRFHALEISGGLLHVFSVFMLSLAKSGHYYQYFSRAPRQGVGMNLASALTFVPTLGIVVHHFKHRRGLASGIVLSGTSIGATFLPISEPSHLLPRIGFAQAVRASGAIAPPCLLLGNLLMRTRLPPRRQSPTTNTNIKSPPIDAPYMWAVFGFFLCLLGVYFPVIYIQLFGVQHHVDSTLAFYSVAIMNAAGGFARVGINHLGDVYGPFNVQTLCSLCTGGMIWAMLSIQDGASLVIISIVYGAFSGAWLSMGFACFASLARGPEEVGARSGIAMALVSVGVLISSPIQGALLSDKLNWINPVGFSGSLMFAGGLCFFITRAMKSKGNSTWRL